MTQQDQTLNSLGKDLIKNLTDNLNAELEKLAVSIPLQDKRAIIERCDKIMVNLKERYDQLKVLSSK